MATAQFESALRRRAEWADHTIGSASAEASAHVEAADVLLDAGTLDRYAVPVVEDA